MSFEESLITLVREREFIFNTKSKQYKNVNKRFEAWEEISRLLERSADDCKQRWKSLRDRFVREKRAKDLPSGSGARVREEWEYYSSLEFLIPSVSTRRQVGNFQETSPESENENDEDLVVDNIEEDTPKRGKKRKAADEEFKKFLNGLSTAMIPCLPGQTPPIDTDEEFMLNMARRMKPLPASAKMRLHLKILGEINNELLQTMQ